MWALPSTDILHALFVVALAADATHVAQLPMPSGWPLLAPEFALQAACLPAAGSPYLTGLATLRPQ